MKFQFCLRTLLVATLIFCLGFLGGIKLHEWKYAHLKKQHEDAIKKYMELAKDLEEEETAEVNEDLRKAQAE